MDRFLRKSIKYFLYTVAFFITTLLSYSFLFSQETKNDTHRLFKNTSQAHADVPYVPPPPPVNDWWDWSGDDGGDDSGDSCP